MADTHGGHGGDHDAHGDLFKTYMTIAVVLCVCTASSFVVNQFVSAKVMAFVLILGVALIKAALVGTYFMHLKWDWNYVYFIMVPVSIMAVMMVFVLLPDTHFGPVKDATEGVEIAQQRAEKAPH